MAGKRKKHKLTDIDEPTEEDIQSSCGKVEAMLTFNGCAGFDVPAPVSKTIYVSQGMRDQEAILLLDSLEAKKTGNT